MPETKEYRMGPARITFAGAVQDWKSRGCKATITPVLKEIKFDQTGDAPYDDLLTGATIDLEMVVAVVKTEDMADKFLAWCNKVVDGTKVLIDGVINVGLSMRAKAQPLLLHPVDYPDDDLSNDLYIPKVVCVSGFQKIYEGTNEDIFTGKFKGYVDDISTKRLFQIGDRSANADATPPTVSSTVPLAAATGIAKASGLNIDFVLSEAIDPSTVAKSNVVIFKTTDETLFTNFTVAYISASNTIRVTTGAALSGTTEYCVVLTGVKDLSGNVLATPYTLKFTTAA